MSWWDDFLAAEKNPVRLMWGALPPNVRDAYGSGARALGTLAGELSPGAAFRDAGQESVNMMGAVREGNWMDAAAGPAKMATAMAGIVPIARGAKTVSRVANTLEHRLPRGTEFRVVPNEEGSKVGYTVGIYDKKASADEATPHYQMIVGETNKGVAPVDEAFNVSRAYRGLGDTLYEKAIEHARSQGIRLTGYGSEDAQKVWNRLAQRGLAERVGEGQYISSMPPGGLF